MSSRYVNDGLGAGGDGEREAASDDDSVPDAEREALLTIAGGAVITAGGVSGQRALTAVTEFALARGLGPAAYGVYALAWRIAQLLSRLVTFGSVPALQRYLPEYADDPDRQGSSPGSRTPRRSDSVPPSPPESGWQHRGSTRSPSRPPRSRRRCARSASSSDRSAS